MVPVRDFEDWYAANSRRLVATVGSAVANDDVARDAVAEACARAYARWNRLGGSDNPTGWVYVVALREARRRNVRRQRDADLTVEGRADVEPSADPALWSAVQELPERMRLAVALRYVGDLGEEEIASIMSISRGGVSSLLHKARAALRTRLIEEVSDDGR